MVKNNQNEFVKGRIVLFILDKLDKSVMPIFEIGG
jgi:hypothetical protein